MQATSRYRFRDFGPGPTRIGVSSAQTTPAVMTSALISMFACRTAAAARARSAWTNPSEGRIPDRDSRIAAHRSTGTWWMTMRNTARARAFSPQVTVPALPGVRRRRRLVHPAAGAGGRVAVTTHISAAMQRRMFRALPNVMRREALEEMVERGIGRQYLQGWVEERMLDRTVWVRAFGARAAHIIAGNAPGIAVRTVAMNALCRSDAIVKIPSNDPYFAAALALTMLEMAPDHPVTKHLCVGYWKGGDREFESRLYDPRNLEKVVAWGGFDSMRSIREYLGPGLDLIALDPKLSASIIGRAALASDATLTEAAERTAADVGIMNQGGCLNARVVYLESGTDPAGLEVAAKFGQLVFDAMQALPEDLSSPHPAFDPDLKAELDGIRYSDDFRVIGGRTNEGAVVVSQVDEPVDFADRLDCRVANIIPGRHPRRRVAAADHPHPDDRHLPRAAQGATSRRVRAAWRPADRLARLRDLGELGGAARRDRTDAPDGALDPRRLPGQAQRVDSHQRVRPLLRLGEQDRGAFALHERQLVISQRSSVLALVPDSPPAHRVTVDERHLGDAIPR